MQLSVMMEWLLRLLPKQKMQDTGDGNVQAGRVEGDLHHSHVVNHYNVQQINVDHQQLAIAIVQANAKLSSAKAPPKAPADDDGYEPVGIDGPPRRERVYRPMPDELRQRPPTPRQAELLALRRESGTHKHVIDDFIEGKLRGKFIKELTDHEVYRATRYVEEAMWRLKVKEEVEGRPVWPD